MGSLDMAPPVGQEHNQEAAVNEEEPELNSNQGATVGGVESGFIREDWSEALQKFVAERKVELDYPNTEAEREPVAVLDTDSEPVAVLDTDSEPVAVLDSGSEAVGVLDSEAVAEEESMEEAEPMASDSGEVAAVVAELMSEAAADDVPVVEEEGAPSGDVEEKALDVEEAAAPSGDVEEKALESGDGVVLASESAENGDASGELVGDELAENGDGEGVAAMNGEVDVEGAAVDSVGATAEDVEEKSVEVNSEEPATEVSVEVPVEESSSEEVGSAPVVAASAEDVEEEGVEVNSEQGAEVGGDVPVEESSEKVDGEAVGGPVGEAVAEAEANEESSQVEAVASSNEDVEEKAVEVNSGDGVEVTEEASAEAPAEESLDNVDSGAVGAPVEEIADVVDAEPEEEPASQAEANPKTSEEEPAEGIDAPVEIVGGSIGEEPMEKAEPSEAVDAHVEESATSGDVEDKAVEVDARDVNEGGDEEASPGEALDASVEEVVAPTDAEPVVELVPVCSDDVEEKAVEMNPEEASQVASPDEVDSEARDAHVEEDVEETTSAEPNEEVSELEAVSAPSDNVEEKCIEENSGDGSEGANVEKASPAEEAPEKVVTEAVDAPVEETGAEVEDAATSAEPDVEGTSEEVESQMPASETEEQSATMATSILLPADEELFDLLEWESKGRSMSDAVPDNSQSLPTEGAPSEREVETVSAEDRSFQVEELPQESETESQTHSIPTEAEVNEGEVPGTPDAQSVTAKPLMISSTEEVLSVPIEHTSEEPSDALAETCDKDDLTNEREHPTASAANIPSIIGSEAKELPSTDDDVANETVNSVGDVSHLLQTVMTDEEVKAAVAIHSPEEVVEAGTQGLESETVHVESEVSGGSQEKEVETVAREFNLNDISEAPISSEVVGGSGDDLASHVVTPYLAPALAVASSETEEGAPKSYGLDEVATHLHDAAAKALQDAEASDGGEESSVAKTVAQIVLEESSNAKDSSEYLSEVVQHVAQFAQEAGQADPNVLPDTVARVFDGETRALPANQVTQSKETTSLGTMVSLFVIWCVSLCASRISSKDMPAPALKLAAEEVTAVLHSNTPSQPTPAQGTATSSH